jgi:hypothetical protein
VQRDEYFMDVHVLTISVSPKQWAAAESGEDAYSLRWTAVRCSGTAPSRRSGVAAALIAATNLAVVFGGGTLWTDGEVHSDVHSLDLTTFEWTRRDTGGKRPPPRQVVCLVRIVLLGQLWCSKYSRGSGSTKSLPTHVQSRATRR